MNKELVTRILIQLEPNLAQEFGLAIAEDEKKLKALENIKEKYFIFKNKDYITIICKKVGYQYKYFDCGLWRKLYPHLAIKSIKVLKQQLNELGFDFQGVLL